MHDRRTPSECNGRTGEPGLSYHMLAAVQLESQAMDWKTVHQKIHQSADIMFRGAPAVRLVHAVKIANVDASVTRRGRTCHALAGSNERLTRYNRVSSRPPNMLPGSIISGYK